MEETLTPLIKAHYGFRATIKAMSGYGSLNYHVRDESGNQYVLKLEPDPAASDFLQAENQLLHHLSLAHALPVQTPAPVPALKGQDLLSWTLAPTPPQQEAQIVLARLLTFVPGTFLAEARQDHQLLFSLGAVLGQLDQALLDQRPVAVERRRIVWDLQYCLDSEIYLPLIADPARQRLARYFFQQYREQVQPRFSQLRRSLIYNDANDWNVLTKDGRVSGIIDFGDMTYAATVQELAVALAYACMHKTDPLEAARPVVAGYQAHFPLEEAELACLYYLVAARLTTSVCMSAYSRHRYPDNPYITVSEAPAWTLLEQWLALNPRRFEEEMRRICGFPVGPPPQAAELLDQRHQFLSRGMKVSYAQPLLLERGALQYLYDERGQTYLDAYNNVVQVGHCHPLVVQAGQRQMARLNTNTRYLYRQLGDYAERLLRYFPAPLRYVYFVNSGSAATDLALRLARTATQRRDLWVLEHGYHGNTALGIESSAYKFDGKGGEGAPGFVHKLPLPDLYRAPEGKTTGDFIAEATALIRQHPQLPGAVIAEPVVGCGGQVFLPKPYLQAVFQAIRERGGLCIVDEVQTGFGRLGDYFWGFAQQEVQPDIVILGKPMGNGHPLAAVVCTEAVVRRFENGMEFFSSFGGNPVSCEIGLAVLEVLENEALPQHATEVGTYLWSQLSALQADVSQIGEVRGRGLFGGIELVQDPVMKRPDPRLARQVVELMRQQSILLGTDGPFDNVIKIKPPLCFSRANADQLIATFTQSIHEAI